MNIQVHGDALIRGDLPKYLALVIYVESLGCVIVTSTLCPHKNIFEYVMFFICSHFCRASFPLEDMRVTDMFLVRCLCV